MKTMALSLSCLCLLLPVAAVAQDATATGGGVKCAPMAVPVIPASAQLYTRDGSDLSDAGEYPPAAKASAVEGPAAVDCQIGPDGYLTQCFVESESPPGYGLGHALAITMLKWAQTSTDRDGHHAGDWLRFSTDWRLPPVAVANR